MRTNIENTMAANNTSGKGGNVGSRTRTEDKTRPEQTGEPESQSLSCLVKGNALAHLTQGVRYTSGLRQYFFVVQILPQLFSWIHKIESAVTHGTR